MTVRTALLCSGTSTTGAVVTFYTAPAGKTVILKDVRVYALASISRAVVLVNSNGTEVSIVDEALSANQAVGRQGFIVLEPGDTIRVYTQSNTMRFMCSGTELAGLAP